MPPKFNARQKVMMILPVMIDPFNANIATIAMPNFHIFSARDVTNITPRSIHGIAG
jgi:hypothetical protein